MRLWQRIAILVGSVMGVVSTFLPYWGHSSVWRIERGIDHVAEVTRTKVDGLVPPTDPAHVHPWIWSLGVVAKIFIALPFVPCVLISCVGIKLISERAGLDPHGDRAISLFIIVLTVLAGLFLNPFVFGTSAAVIVHFCGAVLVLVGAIATVYQLRDLEPAPERLPEARLV